MQCERCHKHEATVHIEGIIGQDKAELHLCPNCAASQNLFTGSEAGAQLANFLSKLTSGGLASLAPDQASKAAFGTSPSVADDRSCPRCGLGAEMLREQGRLGCPQCYEVFADMIGASLKAMHCAGRHRGKVPGEHVREDATEPSAAYLQEELRRAIMLEDYERAAQLRDVIDKRAAAEGGTCG